ncbi:hypothetical protein V2J09_005454 [Rumex salicifolius]
MDFWPEFLASSWGKEFLAGGFGGMAGIVAGYPLDTLRVRQQSSNSGSAIGLLKKVLKSEGPSALYRGMAAPLASVAFQNAVAFQSYAVLSRACDPSVHPKDPPSFKGVVLGGVGTGGLQSVLLSPVELIKIQLQLQPNKPSSFQPGPIQVAKSILKSQGLRGIYRGFTITALRDAPAHGVYFGTYEYVREKLHPGCRKSGQETIQTMLVAGGLAGVASWVFCYPLDVIKTRIQAQKEHEFKYNGIVDCFNKSVKADGYGVLWRGLNTAVARAFVVNGAIFSAYELSLRFLFANNGIHTESTI